MHACHINVMMRVIVASVGMERRCDNGITLSKLMIRPNFREHRICSDDE